MGSYYQMVARFLFTFTLLVPFPYCSLLSCNAPQANINDTSNFGKLVLSQLLLSPGRSNIQHTFPNDGHGSRSNWIEGYGQLTRFGKRDQYELGEWLRKRYGNLPLNPPDNVYVRSVDSDKALTSVMATLAALFAPTKENFTDGLNWQPIPIHRVQKDQDSILEAKPCPKYEAAMKLYLNSSSVMDINHENQDLYKKLTNVTGMQIANIQDVAQLYETLEIQNWRNMSLPEWAANLFPEELLKFSVYSHLIPTSTEELKLLRAGPLLQEMAHHIRDKMNESIHTNASLFIYSAEEDTIVAVLNSLGVFNCLPPQSSAIVLIELWTSEKEISVTVSYKNETTREPYVLGLPRCQRQPLCPLDDFLLVLENSIPQNWTKECSVLSTGLAMETIALRVVCVILAIIMIVMIVLVILCLRRRNVLSSGKARRMFFGVLFCMGMIKLDMKKVQKWSEMK